MMERSMSGNMYYDSKYYYLLQTQHPKTSTCDRILERMNTTSPAAHLQISNNNPFTEPMLRGLVPNDFHQGMSTQIHCTNIIVLLTP